MDTTNFHGHVIRVGSRTVYRNALLAATDGATFVQAITINPEYVVLARKQPELAELTAPPTLTIPDGVGLAWALQHRQQVVERYPGADAVLDICIHAEAGRYPVGVLLPRAGLSTPNEVEQALQARFPKLTVNVWSESEEIVRQINATNTHVLFVAFGQPRQELWLRDHASQLPTVRLGMGVGGTFDFLTGRRRRAPRALRRLGLEWLWRLATQPQRLPRILRATFGFWYVILTSPK